MNPKKPTNPVVIVIMILGILIAGYSVMNSLSSGPDVTAKNTTAAKSATAPTNVGDVPLPQKGQSFAGGRGDAGMRIDNTGAAQAAGPLTSQGSASMTGATQEAYLAPDADPFKPLPKVNMVQAAPAGHHQPPVLANDQGARTASVSGGSKFATGLPPGSLQPINTQLLAQPVAPPKDPELVGTLLGNRPAAIFRTEKDFMTVAVGGSIQGWKVMQVAHGAVLIQKGHRMLQLGSMANPTTTASAKPSSSQSSIYGESGQAEEVAQVCIRDAEGAEVAIAPTRNEPAPASTESPVGTEKSQQSQNDGSDPFQTPTTVAQPDPVAPASSTPKIVQAAADTERPARKRMKSRHAAAHKQGSRRTKHSYAHEQRSGFSSWHL